MLQTIHVYVAWECYVNEFLLNYCEEDSNVMQNKVFQLLWSRYELNCDGYFFGDELVWSGLNWGLIAVWYELNIVQLPLVWIAKFNELSCVSYLAAIENVT